MANILTPTEDFSDANWTTTTGALVTVNTHAAPSTAGVGAGQADTITDSSGLTAVLRSTDGTIANDASDWTASLYVRKDADTSRTPQVLLQFSGGSTIVAGVTIQTDTGILEAPYVGGDADASGVIDVDTDWWRLWFRKSNNVSGNVLLRLLIYPAPASGAQTGSVIVWGANLTNTSSVQPYEPAPAYVVVTPPMILIRHTS